MGTTINAKPFLCITTEKATNYPGKIPGKGDHLKRNASILETAPNYFFIRKKCCKQLHWLSFKLFE